MEIKILLPNREKNGSFDQRIEKLNKPKINFPPSWGRLDVTSVTGQAKARPSPINCQSPGILLVMDQ